MKKCVIADEISNSEEAVPIIIELISDIDGTDPLEMSPLYEIVDPDLIENVVSSSHESASMQFEYRGYNVAVHGDGQICVES